MSLVDIVRRISDDLNTRLGPAGLPDLVDGAILLGPQHIAENASPNRIVFVPVGGDISKPRSVTSRAARSANNALAETAGVLFARVSNKGTGYTTATVTFAAAPPGGTTATGTAVLVGGCVNSIRLTNSGSGYLSAPTVTITGDGSGAKAVAVLAMTDEQLSESGARPLWTDAKHFDVHIWACVYDMTQVPPVQATDDDGDWAAVETLRDVLVQSIQALLPGLYTPSAGHWVSSDPRATKLQILGRYYTFRLTVNTPIADTTIAHAPVGTIGQPHIQLQEGSGTPEAA